MSADVRRRVTGFPVQVAHLIERCIQADPGKRPAMSDILDTLFRAPTAKQVRMLCDSQTGSPACLPPRKH